jgi:hypothetical protein
VHVDAAPGPHRSLTAEPNRADDDPYNHEWGLPFAEIYASTRAYPSWWCEADGRPVSRSTTSRDTILDRNITFIDMTGEHESDAYRNSNQAMSYLQHSLKRTLSLSTLTEHELLDLISGNGGTQVDLIFYVLKDVPNTREAEAINNFSRLTTIVPVLSYSDQHDAEQLTKLKESILDALAIGNLIKSTSQESSTGLDAYLRPEKISAISSAPSTDDDNMDASLLMNSEYIQPLAQSDLQELVADIFNPDAAAQLRHISARKLISWRNRQALDGTVRAKRRDTVLPLPTFHHAATATGSLSPSLAPLDMPLSPNTLARVTDHTQNEERLAQVHLARWASGLQRALHNERTRYASLQEAERTAWLRQRLDERIDVDTADTSSDTYLVKRSPAHLRTPSWSRAAFVDPADPLGLLKWDQRFLRNSLEVVKIVGGAGVVGALVVWLVRWGWGDEWREDGLGGMLWGWGR